MVAAKHRLITLQCFYALHLGKTADVQGEQSRPLPIGTDILDGQSRASSDRLLFELKPNCAAPGAVNQTSTAIASLVLDTPARSQKPVTSPIGLPARAKAAAGANIRMFGAQRFSGQRKEPQHNFLDVKSRASMITAGGLPSKVQEIAISSLAELTSTDHVFHFGNAEVGELLTVTYSSKETLMRRFFFPLFSILPTAILPISPVVLRWVPPQG